MAWSSRSLNQLSNLLACLCLLPVLTLGHGGVKEGLHFSLESRATNIDGSLPIYKDPTASIEARVADLLPRMTIEEKVSQIIQGDVNGWMNVDDPLDDTLTFNQTGLEETVQFMGGSIWAGRQMPWDKLVFAITVGQKYMVENTTLGIPALFQSEGVHGFTDNGTTFPSPIGLAASFDPALISQVAGIIATEAEGLGVSQIFAPVLDLSRELRWGRVEENYGEDHFLTGEIGNAYVTGLQSGRRRNASSTAIARMAATCKHFAAFGSPQSGINLAQVSGGERELRSEFLKPFNRACVNSLAIMTAYSSYDGIPVVSNSHLLTDILRNEWGYKYWVTTDAGSVDLLINFHFTCDTRECAAKAALENGIQGEMGGGSYTYLTLPDQIAAGTVDVKYLDQTVTAMLRTKFSLGLFEDPYPYSDYLSTLRTPASRAILHQVETENIVLLENRDKTLPISKSVNSIALIGPQADRVTFGDYVFFNASNNGITPLDGFKQYLSNISSSIQVNFAEGCKLWSNDDSGFGEAVMAAQASDIAIVMVGTWSLDQTLLWSGANATTGERVDLSDLVLVGAQLDLVKAVKAAGKPTVVVFVSGKPVAEPWIQANADAVVQQFYPGELGGLAIAEVLFGAVNPSGKLPVSFPQAVGTTPDFYNYLKGSRSVTDSGQIFPNGTLLFGHQYVLNTPVPLWSFGHGLSYTTFEYAGGSATITIPVLSSQLAVWTLQNSWVVEPGAFTLKVGTSDQVFAQANLTVT
ncbi:Glycoside hydrolase family 3 protein [Mycena sanguinolenta]|uniref:Glycoside hydrolase family 3 protein n=1 Tax=Mycena sanguinolenta TaxID=230812 RepID=A0A8H6YVM4_9AGAR|nr:Glycoside hydrolase family 3 protein [Mycena sanguinolenta]